MDFLKNSRCVLRKSPLFTSNLLHRKNFKINFGKSRTRWPQDDPTKPPLRLNIPKERPSSSPSNFSPQTKINNDENVNNVNKEERNVNRVSPEIRFGNPEEETTRHTIKAMEKKSSKESGDFSNVSNNLNFPVKSKSTESINSKPNLDEKKPQQDDKVKNFKLKKARSYTEIIPTVRNDISQDSQKKNSILTIDVAFNEPAEGKHAAGTSQVKNNEKKSDEEIKALADAIMSEINPNDKATKAKSRDKEGEDVLVIINIKDKNIPEKAVAQPILSAVPTRITRRKKLKSLQAFTEGGVYGAEKEVRNLELNDEVKKNLQSKKTGTVREAAESEVDHAKPVSNRITSDKGEPSMGNGNQSGSLHSGNGKTSFCGKEGETKFLGGTNRKSQIMRCRSRIQNAIVKMEAKNRSQNEFHSIEADFSRPMEYIIKIGLRTKSKEALLRAEKIEDAIPEVISAEVSLIDHLPNVWIQPGFKRKSRGENKSMDDDKFKNPNVIRSYHNSCKNLSKLTKDFGEGKSLIVTVNFNEKKLDDDNAKEGNGKSEELRLMKEYKSKLDNSCDMLKKGCELPDLNGSNDIYLQEESVIDIKDHRSEEKPVQNENQKMNERNEEDSKDESDQVCFGDEGTFLRPAYVKVPYSAAFPSNRALPGDERKRFEIFRDVPSETFELNVNCLGEKTPKVVKPSNDDGTAKAEIVPKLSDNVVNIANEDLNESKGAPSFDSLSMMKRVREMVDLDLRNAEKIFAADAADGERVDAKVIEKRIPEVQKNIPPGPLKSVLVYYEDSNLYRVNVNELEHAENAAKQEFISDWKKMTTTGFSDEKLKDLVSANVKNLAKKPDIIPIERKGDSIIVYDEKTRSWRVDFSLLGEKLQKHEEVPKKKGESDPPAEKPPKNIELKGGNRSSGDKSEKGANKAEDVKEIKEMDTKEIRKKNSDLYDDVLIGIRKPDMKEEGKDGGSNTTLAKKTCGLEKHTSDHYISENILEMSKSNTVKPRSNKVVTVKPNIAPMERPPSKVTEINLNKKNDDGKGSTKTGSEEVTKKRDQKNGTFYKKFEKYKSPFSDPEYEDKPMKINSDLDSNPNLKKLDSWNKTLVLQGVNKPSDNVKEWLTDETDKMTNLLLRVLQDAAGGNNRRKVTGKGIGKGNPYEEIRKKQENNFGPVKGKKKDSGRKKTNSIQWKKSEIQLKKTELNEDPDGKSKRSQYLITEGDPQMEILTSELNLSKVPSQVLQVSAPNERLSEEIPGPYLLKKMSALWKYLPDVGCQTTIFSLMRMFRMVKTGLSVFSPDPLFSRRNAFSRLFMKYGPVVKIQGPLSGNIVLINRPEDLKNVFIQAATFPASSVMDSVEKCRLHVRKRNFPFELTQSCLGIEWDVMRKSVVDIEDRGCYHFFAMMKMADSAFLDNIRIVRNNQNQVPDDFINDIKRWSMEGLCSIFFDKSLGFLEKKNSQAQWIAESERLMRHLGEATDYLCQCENGFQTWRFIKTPALRGLSNAYQALDLIISKYVHQADLNLRKKKKALASNKSILNKNLNFIESMLLNDGMAPDEITANLIDMLVIGVNTTTVALAFLMYNLAQNGRAQNYLYKEIKDLLPSKKSELNFHQLHSLKYLHACLKESMRLNIPIPFLLRVLPNDIAVANYRINNGTHLIMDTQTACMKEQIFDEPERFKPERWLENGCIHPFSSIPFSNGPRATFVKRLTELQLWTCTAQIVRNFQIEYQFGEIKSSKGVISFPDKPLRLSFIERHD